jgi:polyhydroxybutyrate depolymerase
MHVTHSRVATVVALFAFGLSLLAAPAQAATDTTAGQTSKKQVTKKPKAAPKQVQQKKPAKKTQQSASKKAPPAARASSTQAAGPKPSTDTESKIAKPGDYHFVIQHGGRPRTYRVHVPARYDSATAAPVLVALHGGDGMDSKAGNAYYGLLSKSDREGFVAVFPTGYSRSPGQPPTWNAGTCCGAARDDKVDDVGFIRQVVSNVFGQVHIDRQRIYATGVSNGAMMAYRLACEMPEVFRAVAAVAATDQTASCTPRNPVSVLHIHAKDDKLVPLAGATSTVAKWAQLNGCRMAPERTLQMAGAYCDAYSYCRGQTEVQLCVTDTGGHSWPGGTAPRQERPSQAISATTALWDFLSRH